MKKFLSITLALAMVFTLCVSNACALDTSDLLSLLGGQTKKTSNTNSLSSLLGLLGGNTSKKSSTSDLTSLLNLLGGNAGKTNSNTDLLSLLSLLGGNTGKISSNTDLLSLLNLLGGNETNISDLTSLLGLLGGTTGNTSDLGSLLGLLGGTTGSTSDLTSLYNQILNSNAYTDQQKIALLDALTAEMAGDYSSEEVVDRTEDAISKCEKGANCPLAKFIDLETTAWYHDGIHYCVSEGLINGFPGNLYKPQNKITRGQLIVILYRFAEQPAITTTVSYKDVAADSGNSWYVNAALWAKENAISNGRDGVDFGVNDEITREEFANILFNYAKYRKVEGHISTETARFNSYSDVAKVSSDAVAGMIYCINAGVINGDNNGYLNPLSTTTRAEAAAMIQRFIQQ